MSARVERRVVVGSVLPPATDYESDRVGGACFECAAQYVPCGDGSG